MKKDSMNVYFIRKKKYWRSNITVFKQLKDGNEKDGEKVLSILLYRTISNYLKLQLKSYRSENRKLCTHKKHAQWWNQSFIRSLYKQFRQAFIKNNLDLSIL